MTPKTVLTTAFGATALVLALLVSPAWGQPAPDVVDRAVAQQQQQRDFWNYDQSGTKVTNASPGVAPDQLGGLYSGQSGVETQIVSPDAVERAVAARQALLTDSGRNLRFDDHRGTGGAQRTGSYPDVIDRAVAAKLQSNPQTFQDRQRLGDNFRDVPKQTIHPAQISSTDSGRELEWPQIGVGFGIGILLAIGLMLALRMTRIRPLAH
jgi:hypothetical protein